MRTRLSTAAVFAALALPGAAVAQTPSDDTYGPDPTRSSSTGSTPFTGLELGLVIAAGTGLLGMGVAVRRQTRLRPDDS